MANAFPSAARAGAPLVAALAALALAGCATPPSAPPLPATWAGTLECAGCAGVEHRLTLNPDGSYWLVLQYRGYPQGDPPPVREIGRYAASDGRYTFESEGTVRHWTLIADGRLAPLASADAATPRAVGPQGALVRQPVADREFGPLRVRGVMTYLADAAAFESCATGLRYAVVGGAGKARAELEYSRTAAAPGAPVLVAFEGTLRPKPAGEEGLATWLSVDAWERAVADAACDGRPQPRSRR